MNVTGNYTIKYIILTILGNPGVKHSDSLNGVKHNETECFTPFNEMEGILASVTIPFQNKIQCMKLPLSFFHPLRQTLKQVVN